MGKRIAVLGNELDAVVHFRGGLLQAMVAAGHAVTVIAPGPTERSLAQLGHWGVDFQAIPMQRTGTHPVKDAQTCAALAWALGRRSPDRVLAITIKPIVYGALAARLVGIPWVVSMITGLGYVFTEAKAQAVRKIAGTLYRGTLPLCDRVVFQNAWDERLFHRLGWASPEQTRVVPGSGVDTEYFSPMPLPSKPIFVMVARLLREKGVYEYAAAARAVKSRFPEAEFWLVGGFDKNPGSIQPNELQPWVDQGFIRYFGQVGDVRSVISQAQVFVLPSYREGLPRSTLEALSMGRPIVTTHAPGCSDTVREGINGLKVRIKDSAALARACESFVIDAQLSEKMGTQSRALAVSRFAAPQVYGRLIEALNL